MWHFKFLKAIVIFIYFLNIKLVSIIPVQRHNNLLINENNALSNSNKILTSEGQKLLQFIFSNLNAETIVDTNKKLLVTSFKENISNIPPEKKLPQILFELKNIINLNPSSDFSHFGQLLVEKENDTENYFEVYLRFTNISTIDELEIEFLLIDVTHSVIHEKNKSEFKYKSIFFSKVAHEFKNPLICMNEIVTQIDQIKENNNIKLPKEVEDNLNYLKSMSNFLLVLVKDLDFFSQSQIGKNTQTENNEVNISELTKFCTEISECLLRKYNKYGKIQFNVQKILESNIYLISDENRLKQILINLISNAIKFTLFGEIKLEIKSVENDKIRFSVIDTGCGIKEEKMKSLFLPFQKGQTKNNENGAGLGLSIVNDLAKSLGSEINFVSNTTGSTFWLDLCLSKQEKLVRQRTLQIDQSPNEDLNLTKTKSFEPNDLVQISVEDDPFLLIKSKIEHSNEEEDYEEQAYTKLLLDKNSNKLTVMNFNNCPIILSERSHLDTSSINNRNTKSTRHNSHKFTDDLDIDQLRLNCRETMNFIVVDDEKFTREAIVRIINQVAKKEKLKINVFEAEDGVETIYLTYKLISNGIKISAFLSDETMNYIKGSQSSQIIEQMFSNHNLSPPRFYLLTALQGLDLNSYKFISGLYPKPVTKGHLSEIIMSL